MRRKLMSRPRARNFIFIVIILFKYFFSLVDEKTEDQSTEGNYLVYTSSERGRGGNSRGPACTHTNHYSGRKLH